MNLINFIYKLFLFLAFYGFFFSFLLAQSPKKKDFKPKDESLSFELLSSDLTGPVAIAAPKDGTGRIFVLEQAGKIKVLKGNSSPKEFLDLRKKLTTLNQFYSEKGLLGMAFHPEYKENRKFYLNYSAKSKLPGEDHRTVVSEFITSFGNPDKAMLKTEKVILEISQPESNHNGGSLEFGPDGFLYISSGDGGGAGDDHGTIGNSQNLQNLLGKILRIDINSAGVLYQIPTDNPSFPEIGKSEIFAYGLRNPWKFSFDRSTKRLFAGDVGQDKYEEVNIITKGKNYGWKIMEGMHCFFPPEDCSPEGLTLPIHEYDHSVGNSIIGGYVFRGNPKSPYFGKYIFGDWSGKVFSLTENKGKWTREELKINKGSLNWSRINSFGEDEKGNLYLLAQEEVGPNKKGYVLKLKL